MLAAAVSGCLRYSCAIKGNISGSGERIYHVPGDRYYDATTDQPGQGRAVVLQRGRGAGRWLEAVQAVRFLVLIGLLVAQPAFAEALSGRCQVTDGDTVRVGGIAVRLKGIAAPEMSEPGGTAAREFLVQLAEGRTVVCDLTQERTHGRRVGLCRLDGQDIAEAVIAAGLARDCPRFSGGRYSRCRTSLGSEAALSWLLRALM